MRLPFAADWVDYKEETYFSQVHVIYDNKT